METKKIILGGIAGSITLFLLGWLLYGMLLANFFASHPGTVTGFERGDADMLLGYIFLGNLAQGFLYAIVLGWANINTAGAGIKAGLIMGLLIDLGFGLVMYGTTTLMSRTALLGDVATFTVMSAIACAVIATVMGMGKKSD